MGNPRNFYYGRGTEIRVKFALRMKSSTRDTSLRKKSTKELFTTDSEVILRVKTCSKGPNLRQGIPPVVNIFYGGKRSKKGAKLCICSPAFFLLQVHGRIRREVGVKAKIHILSYLT